MAQNEPVYAGTGFARKLTTICHHYDRNTYERNTFERERDKIAKAMNNHRKRLEQRRERMKQLRPAPAQGFNFDEAFLNVNLAQPVQVPPEWQQEIVAHVIDIAEDEMDEYEAEYNEDEDER
jgi:hypothetical protein